jgi:hypothetical protein
MIVATKKAVRLESPLKSHEQLISDRIDPHLDQIVNDFLKEFEADYRQRIDNRKKNETDLNA